MSRQIRSLYRLVSDDKRSYLETMEFFLQMFQYYYRILNKSIRLVSSLSE